MLKITEKQYRNMRKNGRITKALFDKGISIIMPEKEAKKWLKALRSGEYGQTHSTMTDGNGGFCCLGVQQHCTLNGYIEVDNDFDIFESLPTMDYLRDNGIIYAELDRTFTNNPYIVSKNTDVASINDELHNGMHQFDFEEIANMLENSIAVY